MPISDKLATQALAKIREQEQEISELRKRLGTSDLGSAIQESLERPTTGNRRNQLVSDITRAGLFRDRTTPVTKAEREQTEKSRKEEIRRARNEALGIQNAKRGR